MSLRYLLNHTHNTSFICDSAKFKIIGLKHSIPSGHPALRVDSADADGNRAALILGYLFDEYYSRKIPSFISLGIEPSGLTQYFANASFAELALPAATSCNSSQSAISTEIQKRHPSHEG